MASRSFLPEEDLSCPVCCDIFTDPVLLTCSHSFCKTCIHDCWKDKESRDCPVCRQCFLLAEPPCNQALKNVCEDFKEKRIQKASAGSEVLCSLHSEKLKLFCLEDKEPICMVCQISKKHRSHQFVPLDEAAQDHREKLQTALKPLEEKLKVFTKVKQTCDQIADHIKTQTENTERNIKEEFKKLHLFLQEEEEARISALRGEEKQKSEKMREKSEGMNREITSLSDTIKVIEEELRADDTSFLQKFKATKERAQVTLPDPQLVSGALIDVAKHLGNLTFRVWEKMKGLVKFTPVILDPNTAARWLSLSDGLTSVGQHGQIQQLPDNPERFIKYANVRGSVGFSSGKQSWEVDVGDHPGWSIGVARESWDMGAEATVEIAGSVENAGCMEDRVGWRRSMMRRMSIDKKGVAQLTSKSGSWCIVQRSGNYTNGAGKTLHPNRRPERIRVQLDCDRGEVSFYDTEDMTRIYTHKDTFTEKLYPCFCIGTAGDAKHPDVNILQSELSVSVMSSCSKSTE